MKELLDAMEKKLSGWDAEQLKKVYEPMVVAAPPTDACKHLCLMPDGEIRIYGFAQRRTPTDEVGRIYIASADCGLSWKTYGVGDDAMGAAQQSPQSGRWLGEFPLENRNVYPEGYPDPASGAYVMINAGGPDAPVERFVKLCDERMHFQKQPYYFERWRRWIIPMEYRHADGHKYINVAWSDDDGDTWDIRELTPHAPMFEVTPPHQGTRWQDYSCEPTIVELSDGTLLMHERTSQDYHYRRLSHDGGITWTAPEPSVFHGTLTMPVLHRLSDGRILHFWCNNQPLPEMDHEAQWPPLNPTERQGVWEDVFTNRDVNHMAISEDDGRTWIGMREVALNPIRNQADFRSFGGADSRDKSVHQGEMLELPFGKLLLSYGQNAAVRKVVLLDPNWLYERERREDFRYGLEKVTTHLFLTSNSGGYRGFSGHCAWNRTNGALLCPDPDGNFEEALRIARVHDPRLVLEKQGVVWNFPAAGAGTVSVRLRVEGNGVQLCLSDHWFNACDETVAEQAIVRFEVADAPKDRWIDVTIEFGGEKAVLKVNGTRCAECAYRFPAPCGLSYLHIQTLAGEQDFQGTLIKSLAAQKKD